MLTGESDCVGTLTQFSLILSVFSGGKRKPSFKMVSNMVIQLLHTIKFSMEVPFSNMTQQPVEMQKSLTTKKVNI